MFIDSWDPVGVHRGGFDHCVLASVSLDLGYDVERVVDSFPVIYDDDKVRHVCPQCVFHLVRHFKTEALVFDVREYPRMAFENLAKLDLPAAVADCPVYVALVASRFKPEASFGLELAGMGEHRRRSREVYGVGRTGGDVWVYDWPLCVSGHPERFSGQRL